MSAVILHFPKPQQQSASDTADSNNDLVYQLKVLETMVGGYFQALYSQCEMVRAAAARPRAKPRRSRK